MIFDARSRKDDRSARVGMSLFRLSQAIKKMTQAESDALGLSPVQIQTLLFAFHTRGDAATVGNLAHALGTTHVTAVKTANGLVRKGLIVKTPKADDRRVTLLGLTEEGRRTASNVERWGRALEDALRPISDDALAHFELGLGAIVAALQRSGYLFAAEPCYGCVHFRPNAGDAAAPHYCELVHTYLTHEASLKECPDHTPSKQA
ncbi:MarR family winged helix-turn-helix transcriptional regulator [Paenibacillus flagellatus]|uniref:MarR family transcriptional regulator n=1 Tax=Paenibacillus flagellatus TaxID=2211139 RepID=A0A2V5KZL8_9BACL|nr:MarR family winged helix-turn-helix transcriptional regulator [Paenibacillus flagellatus]PYI55616.1 MarR family transcriptional regulator [Paenibacillus flagellatus]